MYDGTSYRVNKELLICSETWIQKGPYVEFETKIYENEEEIRIQRQTKFLYKMCDRRGRRRREI